MADPHNPKRYGEKWSQDRLLPYYRFLDLIKKYVILSGGWAWHFMSPIHEEYKHLHDHKDLDIFVKKTDFVKMLNIFQKNGFKKGITLHDSNLFYRYEKDDMVIDMFLYNTMIPSIVVYGFSVVEPKQLITYYSSIHSSKNCIAVTNARKLLQENKNPINHPDLIKLPIKKSKSAD